MAQEEEREPSAPIRNTDAVMRFMEEFRPWDGSGVPEVFSIGRLRDYLCAWPTPMGIGSGADDPLAEAMLILSNTGGFKMQGTAFSGACLLVTRREEIPKLCMDM